jgi:hypothetical protein
LKAGSADKPAYITVVAPDGAMAFIVASAAPFVDPVLVLPEISKTRMPSILATES